MAHDDKNRKDTKGSFRLAICSRFNHACRPLFQPESSRCASDPRRRIGRLRKFATSHVLKASFLEVRYSLLKLRHLQPVSLIANPELEFHITHRE